MAVHIQFRARGAHGDCHGDDETDLTLAGWSKARLSDSGLKAGRPTRYEWGFEIPIRAKGYEYFAGLSTRKNSRSNWHLFLERRMSIRDRLQGKSLPVTEPMALLLQEIIAQEPDFRVVSVQERW